MIYRVVIQPPARQEIEAAYLYIRERAPLAAERWLDRMEAAIAGLERFPRGCAVAPESREFDEEIRQLLLGRRRGIYRVLFVIRGDVVHVLHVRHGARRPMSRGEIEP